MDTFLSALMSAILSGLVVGGLSIVFQTKVSKSVDDAKEATHLKFKNIMDKVLALQKGSDMSSVKLVTVESKIGDLSTKVSLLIAEQKHLVEDFQNLKEAVKEMGQRFESWGRVIKK